MELLSQVGNIQELIENPFDFLSSSLEGAGESGGKNRKRTGYEGIMRQKQQAYDQEREYRQLRMLEKYPKTFILIHSFILFIIVLVIFILQIFLTVNNSVMASYGFGIWLGVYYFMAIGLVMLTNYIRKYKFLLAALMMHMFGLFLTAFFIIILNIVAISQYSCSLWFTNQNCVESEYLKSIHICLIVFGFLCFLTSLVFIIYIQITLFNSCDYAFQYQQDKPRIKTIYPQQKILYQSKPPLTPKNQFKDPIARVNVNPQVSYGLKTSSPIV
jgi:hypothetical protein